MSIRLTSVKLNGVNEDNTILQGGTEIARNNTTTDETERSSYHVSDSAYAFENTAFEGDNIDVGITKRHSIAKSEDVVEKASIDDVEIHIPEPMHNFDDENNWTLQKQQLPDLENPDDEDSYTSTQAEKGCYSRSINAIQSSTSQFFNDYGKIIKQIVFALMLIAYGGYFAWSLFYEFGTESSIRLLWMTMAGMGLVIITMVKARYGHWIYQHIIRPPVNFISDHFTVFKWAFMVCAVAGIIIYIAIEVGMHDPANLVSLSGYFIFVLLLFMFSRNPAKVKWRPVLWGLGLQFMLALLVLRTVWGYEVFKWLGDRVAEYMAYSDAGAAFVFGDNFEEHFFAFSILPVIIFFSSTITILYYLGVMQVVILKIAWVMQKIMGTTAAESVNAAGNIFVGQNEAPLLIRPLLGDMTNSEIHAVMTGGFGTIAGSVMAAYIAIGVSATHLITASVMAAPCALAMSKLTYPEVQKSKTKASDVANMEPSPQRNILDAASAGATAAITVVACIAVNQMAFISLLEFVNTVLTWMGHRAGMWPPEYPELTFELICSYVLWPFAFFMGVAKEDCRQVAELIGIKTFLNEFVAYEELAVLIENSNTFETYNGSYVYIQDDIFLKDANVTLVGGVMTDRSITIATYALCGFANFGAVGSIIGTLGSMVPEKTPDIASMAPRALIAGTVTSFMNACVAGLLYSEAVESA